MSATLLTQGSLFRQSQAELVNSAQSTRLARSVQQFEGFLWNEVAQAMSAVHFGRSDLGYAGEVYQRMLWRKIAARDFTQTDQGLTRETLAQLVPNKAQASFTTAGQLLSIHRNTQPVMPPPVEAQRIAHEGSNNSVLGWARRVWGAIQDAAGKLDVPPQALLAQAALETGWGRHVRDNNVFGVKASGKGPSFTALTHEFSDGVLHPVQAAFQSYGSVTQAMEEFVQMVLRVHPQASGQNSVTGYAQAMQASGYATDPRYAAKIEAVAASPRMHSVMQALQSDELAG